MQKLFLRILSRWTNLKCSFHCLFCHGYEERGAESVGVITTGLITTAELVGHVSPMAARLSKGVTVYTNGNVELSTSIRDALKSSSKFRFEDRKIARYQLQNGGPTVQITLEDGTVHTQGFAVSHPKVEQRAPFTTQLGLDTIPSGEIKVFPPFNETSLPGCFAAGDMGSPMKSALQAMHMGAFAAVGMTSQLQKELLNSDEL
jgi:thioredoxin reductase